MDYKMLLEWVRKAKEDEEFYEEALELLADMVFCGRCNYGPVENEVAIHTSCVCGEKKWLYAVETTT